MKQFFAERKLPFSWQRIGFVVGIVFVTLVLLMGIFVSGVYWYNDKVLPGVHIGEIAVGGMKKEELRSFIESMNDKFVGEGVPITFVTQGENKQFVFYPVRVDEGITVERVQLDVDADVSELMRYGKSGDMLDRVMQLVGAIVRPARRSLSSVQVDSEGIIREVTEYVHAYELPPRDATLLIRSLSPLRYEITTSSPGTLFAYDRVPEELRDSWAKLQLPRLTLASTVAPPAVT